MKFRLLLIHLLSVFSIAAVAHEPPVMGWSSWNTYRVDINDSLIMRQADAMVALGLDSLGYRYINIDDGFFGGRDQTRGKLLFHPRRFPNGLKPVVDHIHALGLKAGIYSDAGENTCGNFWDNDTIAKGVGLYGHELADCELFFKDLGFDFIKVDFCGGDARQNFDSLSLEPAERYLSIWNSIRSTGRDDVRMNVCRWNFPGTWVCPFASSWRISQDISPSWESVRDIISQNLYLSAYASRGHYNDMDMLEVGRGLSEAEERTHFGMWCIMSSPLLIGCDLTALPESTLSLLRNKDLIALNQDSLGLQAYVVHRENGGYVLVKDIREIGGRSRAVAFYNPTDSLIKISLLFNEIELGGNIRAHNLFDGSRKVFSEGQMSVTLEPHATEIYSLTGESRLMRQKYEAETAFLSHYQELENPLTAHTAFYDKDEQCSGGMKVTNAGNIEGNDVIFNQVSVDYPGKYKLTFICCAPEDSCIGLEVNGEKSGPRQILKSEGFIMEPFEVMLKNGNNTIRLYSDSAPLPEIDYMYVEEISK